MCTTFISKYFISKCIVYMALSCHTYESAWFMYIHIYHKKNVYKLARVCVYMYVLLIYNTFAFVLPMFQRFVLFYEQSWQITKMKEIFETHILPSLRKCAPHWTCNPVRIIGFLLFFCTLSLACRKSVDALPKLALFRIHNFSTCQIDKLSAFKWEQTR